MKKLFILVYLLICNLAFATSSILPTIPLENSSLASAPIRNNFLAAYTDVNNILNQFSGSSAPANPSTYQYWVDTSANPVVLNIFDGQNWVATASLNTSTHVWNPIGTYAGGTITVPYGGTGATTLTGLALGNGVSPFTAYGGTSCTNQFPRSLSAVGAATCATIANTDLANSSVTIGSTNVALGATAATVSGLTLVAPALGTPASGVATNLTGTAAGLISGASNGLVSATTTVTTSSSVAPTAGQQLIANSGTTATWKSPFSNNASTYGVLCDNSTDDVANLNAAILAVHNAGGGTLNINAGTCILSSTISMQSNVRIQGSGKTSTILQFSNTGDGIVMTSPINSATKVYVSISNIQISNTNPSNTGAGYDDVGGTDWSIEDVIVSGFKFGIILDQSEIVTIQRSKFISQINSGAGIWLVDGADHTMGASPGFTNSINIEDSYFQEPATIVGIASDGAIVNKISGCTFEGGLNAVRDAQSNILLSGNFFEDAFSSEVSFNNTSFIGTSLTYLINATITGNSFGPTPGQSSIVANSYVRNLISSGNNYNDSSPTEQIVLGSNVFNFFSWGDDANFGVLYSGTPIYTGFVNSETINTTFTGPVVFGSTINGNTFTTGTGTLTLAAGKTLTASNTLTLAGTDSTTMTFPSTSATIARTDAANTFTGHQTIEGVTSTGATGTGNLVFGTSPTLVTPALGTPASGVATNLTGTASGLTAGTVTTNANLTGPITSSGNATSIASQTGTGSTFVVQNTPTLTTPNIGAATGTSLNTTGVIWTTNMSTTLATTAFGMIDNGGTYGIGLGPTSTEGVINYSSGTANTAVFGHRWNINGTQRMKLDGTGLLAVSGAVTATTYNGNTVTTGTGTLTLAAGKTFTASNTLTLAGTDSTTMTFPSTSATIARTDAANTFTGNQSIVGSYSHTQQESDLSYTYNTPTTGQTVTLASGTETAIINPAGTLATLTVTLPGCTSGYDGSIARYSSTQIITSLTVNATSGTVADAATSLSLGGGNSYICRGSTTTWYRLY